MAKKSEEGKESGGKNETGLTASTKSVPIHFNGRRLGVVSPCTDEV